VVAEVVVAAEPVSASALVAEEEAAEVAEEAAEQVSAPLQTSKQARRIAKHP
jgi:hypothetical protein